MNDLNNESKVSPLEKLASDVVGQVRRGERPSNSDLRDRYPELTHDVDSLVSTLSMLEEAGLRRRTRRPADCVTDSLGIQQKTLGGFRLIREINRGGMGIVYEAEQESLKRRVAVKVLPPSPMLTDTDRQRFEREGIATARLHHSNIVPVYGTGIEHGVRFCVMQYVEGFSLDRLIAGMRQKRESINHDLRRAIDLLCSPALSQADNVIEPSTAASSRKREADVSTEPAVIELPDCYWRNMAHIGARVASALAHSHNHGILHRDVKPGNLMLGHDGHVWLSDFGLAKLHDTANLTGKSEPLGTLRYTSPEQFNGRADARSDIYALGLTLYELCTLEPAFQATDRRELMQQVLSQQIISPRVVNPRIPRELETILLKSIAVDANDRYQSASDQATDFRNFIEDRPLIARRQSYLERSTRWCRKHPLETTLASFSLLMLLLFAATACVAYVRESRLRQVADADAERTRKALDHVYESYLPDWTNSSNVSAHGAVSVTPQSARLLEELVQFYDALAKRSRSGEEMQAVLDSTAALRRVGLIYLRLGRIEKSRQAYAQANKRLERAYANTPDVEFLREQSRIFNDIGTTYWTDRNLRQARRYHELALASIEKSPVADSGNAESQFELARTLYLIGRKTRGLAGGVTVSLYESEAPRIAPAPSNYIARAAFILDQLANHQPENREISYLRALCYREDADRSCDLHGELVDESMVKAIQILESLSVFDPGNIKCRYALCTTLQWSQTDVSVSAKACEVIAERIRRSVDIAERLVSERPDEWIYAASHVESLIKLANVLNRADRLVEALKVSERAIGSSIELSKKFIDCDVFRLLIAHSHRRRGDLLQCLPEASVTALEEYRSAIDQLDELLGDERFGLKISALKNLEAAHFGRAQVLQSIDATAEAEEANQKALLYRNQLQLSKSSDAI